MTREEFVRLRDDDRVTVRVWTGGTLAKPVFEDRPGRVSLAGCSIDFGEAEEEPCALVAVEMKDGKLCVLTCRAADVERRDEKPGPA